MDWHKCVYDLCTGTSGLYTSCVQVPVACVQVAVAWIQVSGETLSEQCSGGKMNDKRINVRRKDKG